VKLELYLLSYTKIIQSKLKCKTQCYKTTGKQGTSFLTLFSAMIFGYDLKSKGSKSKNRQLCLHQAKKAFAQQRKQVTK
jgi:hypothetical protein